MKAQEIRLGVLMLTLSVLNNNINTAAELQMNFYLNISERNQQSDKHKQKSHLRQLSYLKLMNLKNNVCSKTTKLPFQACAHACVTRVITKVLMSLEHHGTSMKGSQPVNSWINDRNSQLEIMSRLFPYHAA